MNQEQWTAVDRYITDTLAPPDPDLEQALASTAAAGLPAIQVSVAQGQMLRLLSQIQQARTIFEVGTLGGDSTIGLARALPPSRACAPRRSRRSAAKATTASRCSTSSRMNRPSGERASLAFRCDFDACIRCGPRGG